MTMKKITEKTHRVLRVIGELSALDGLEGLGRIRGGVVRASSELELWAPLGQGHRAVPSLPRDQRVSVLTP